MGNPDTFPAGDPDSPTVSLGGSTPTPPGSEAGHQFLPGTHFGNRYRIVELLGRGGMGEVYRADDLQLGQSVALKFLPPQMVADSAAMTRLRQEVRVARQVAHPNVCRVYDIGEANGLLFLSMEYIDGEDLGSVLRRLGRPTPEKSAEIARQLCIGLAAAHDAGVLHRDLKPDNVMIDGRGRVRITDFSLAAFARELGEAGLGGTPAYMAPELFRGVAASTRSDIYSLGAVLYELFTGRPVFRGANISDYRRLHEKLQPKRPSECATNIEPVVEEIILRCLSKDPAKRPMSALAVAATLPGQDLVQAALAAGQTPSPEIVAEAGGKGALKPVVGVALLLGVIGGMLLIAGLNRTVSLQGLTPPKKATVVVADQAREILDRLGHPAQPGNTVYRWEAYDGYLRHIEHTDPAVDRWDRLSEGRPPVYWLWYRTSPIPLVPRNELHQVRYNDPPQSVPGMAALKLDDQGRLAVLRIVPPQAGAGPPAPEPVEYDWLFEVAGLNFVDFQETSPEWTPPDYADARIAWTGHYPERPDLPLRVEAASFAGSPVYFNVLEHFDQPWTGPREDTSNWLDHAEDVASIGLLVVALIVPPLIARRNLRRGTGDRIGAVRLGVAVWAIALVSWFLRADHVSDVSSERDIFLLGLAGSVLLGLWSTLAYLGLEPYVRRLLPDMLISWTRLLLGRFTNPRVGRDVLIGALVGVLVIVIQRVEWLVPAWIGSAPRTPYASAHIALDGGPKAWSLVIEPGALSSPLLLLLTVTGLLYIFKRRWLAFVLTFVIWALADGHMNVEGPAIVRLVAVLEVVLVWWLLLFTLVRFGLLAVVSSFFFFNLLQRWPLVLDTEVWFAGTSFAGIILLGVVAAVAGWLAIRRQGAELPRPI